MGRMKDKILEVNEYLNYVYEEYGLCKSDFLVKKVIEEFEFNESFALDFVELWLEDFNNDRA